MRVRFPPPAPYLIMSYRQDLERALHLADVADAITAKFYRSSTLSKSEKPDHTPVTEADLAVEETLSSIVTSDYGDGYLGEEGTDTQGSRQWIIDPIDGTKNFIRHMPIWATLIALTENGNVVAATVSAPALGRRWWAAKGEGAWTKDVDGAVRQLQTSRVNTLSDAFILTSSLPYWDNTPASSDQIINLIKSVWRQRSLGDFLNYMMVAEGAADACLEAGTHSWDVAAPSLIVAEAGGEIWENSYTTGGQDTDVFIATNGHLGKDVRNTLNL